MSGAERVALVSGANKGIGFEIVRQLLERDEGIHVLLESRYRLYDQLASAPSSSQSTMSLPPSPSHFPFIKRCCPW